MPSIGYLNASVFVASMGSGQAFASAKEFAVWLGITPKQFASGNNNAMGGISKRGDQYLRKQLIHGARAIISHAGKKNDALYPIHLKMQDSAGIRNTFRRGVG